MDWKIIFLLFVVVTTVVCDEDDDDSAVYDEKKFHIQGRQVGDAPHCVVTRRRRSVQSQSELKKYSYSPTLTSPTASGSPIQLVTGHQMVETVVPNENEDATNPTGTGIISPTVTDTETPTGTSRPIEHPVHTATATGVTSPTATATGATSPTATATGATSPTTNDFKTDTSQYPNRGSDEKYKKKYKKIRDNKKVSKIDDQTIEKVGTGINAGTKTNTNTLTGTRTKTETVTRTGTGVDERPPNINCIIVNRSTPAPAQNNGIFGSLFNVRRKRSLRNIRKKFGLNFK